MVQEKDKYQIELERAQAEATFIPSDMRILISGFIFLGATQGQRGTVYYYKNQIDGKYYHESEFDRHMRNLIRKNKLNRYAKK